tara:strand:+ start:137109 stop:137702 length:594 start_codon:yes stop_codon:yes gene_type:complete
MSLNLTHTPTHWFFSIEEIIADCDEHIKTYQKYTNSDVSDMARGLSAPYEDRKQIALGLQQLYVPYITVKATDSQSPIVDLNKAITDRRFDRTSPLIFNKFAARPAPDKLQAYGAYYKLDHILEDSAKEVLKCSENFDMDKSKSYSNYSQCMLSAAKDFNTAVESLVNKPSQGLTVTFDQGQNPDLGVKAKIRSLTL